MFKGSIVALVTPFDKDCDIDESSIRKLIKFHKENGTNGILVIGCTGESFTIEDDERERIIQIAREEVEDGMYLIAGTGASSTKLTVERTRRAWELGVDGVLVITPFGNKPSQEAHYEHYKAVSEVGVPIILYNVPSRTGTNLVPETVARLSEIQNIVAIKEASGNLDQVTKIKSICGITVLSGDDALTLPMLSIGGMGVISTCANIVPRDMSDMVKSFSAGDFKKARELHLKMFPLIKALFLEGNPVPLKAAMEMMGLIEGNLRPPLRKIGERNLEILKNEIKEYGLV
ncbi:4-hydroxy-tetrahydrodipicolinate synthase [bacterium]|nr:4-hydroxy-tetrahydrodipicolinate synthase [bacterium]